MDFWSGLVVIDAKLGTFISRLGKRWRFVRRATLLQRCSAHPLRSSDAPESAVQTQLQLEYRAFASPKPRLSGKDHSRKRRAWPTAPGQRSGMPLVRTWSVFAILSVSACSDPQPAGSFRVHVAGEKSECLISIEGRSVTRSELAGLAKGRRDHLSARIVSPATGVAPSCVAPVRAALERAGFRSVTFASAAPVEERSVAP